MKEIRFHGRGGQGAVMASELLVHATIMEGKYGQSIPAYGFERRGAPLQAFVKMDNKPIRERVQVVEPDGIIVLDESLLGQIPIYEGMKKGSFAIINSRRNILLENVDSMIDTLGFVDANRIALDIFKAPITNTILLGAFASTTSLITIESLKEAISNYFPKEIIEKNLLAVERGYREAVVVSRSKV
ncbi:2-oxoacid:acceptor oxidoreductase family protein [Bacillus sp. FJAT-45350]|uniref:2-oxoacid:acceptor oxidoreductase family protein n=1 Tax=Bacillus sp. FJAT-45350 TaxID=2011014 RepID=UPI000BB6BE82|nr:2-oxoacid:acceptor oxidoreductase family protein [Bacillus sp. FJAT-45350]